DPPPRRSIDRSAQGTALRTQEPDESAKPSPEGARPMKREIRPFQGMRHPVRSVRGRCPEPTGCGPFGAGSQTSNLVTTLETRRPRGRRLRAGRPSPRWFRSRPRLEWMEDRTLLATFLVTTTSFGGPGSLRQAILDSNAATSQTNLIKFDIPG